MKHVHLGRRVACAFLVVMLLVMTASPALAASKPKGSYVVATSEDSRLRVRATPGGKVVDHLNRGSVVTYRGAISGWWYVEYRNGTGYVDKSKLWSVTKSKKAKYVPVDNVWVRLDPKIETLKLGKLKKNMQVTITAQSGSWVKIKYKSYAGWVPAKYLKRVS